VVDAIAIAYFWVGGISLIDGLRMVAIAIRMVHRFHIAITVVRP